METLLKDIESLKNSNIKDVVDTRIKEFETIGNSSDDIIFSELCFCIMTANFNAERSMTIQNKMKNGFCELEEQAIVEKLKELGHRFPNARAKYIAEARNYKESLKELLKGFESHLELREWLVKNVKGLGYKEASHFLRNIGFKDLAIIDFHIIDLLVRHNLIEKPKSLTRKRYLEIEEMLKTIAEQSNLSLAELDLYLWYMETGKILK